MFSGPYTVSIPGALKSLDVQNSPVMFKIDTCPDSTAFDSYSADLGWNLKSCISNKHPK